MRAAWVVLVVGCGGGGHAPRQPSDHIAALYQTANDHRELVQASFDMAEIGDFEAGYDTDWASAADSVRAAFDAAGCLQVAPEEEGWTAVQWLDNLDEVVRSHIDQSRAHQTFQECWVSEDDHHHDIADGIDALEAALDAC